MPRALTSDSFQNASCNLANVYRTPSAHLSVPPSLLKQWGERHMNRIPKRDNEKPDLHETAGCAVADYMRRKYPKHTAKLVARDAGCEPCTAKHWLKGYLPGSKHLLNLLERWGLDFLVCLLEPVDASMAREIRLKTQIEKLTQDLEHLKKEINPNEG